MLADKLHRLCKAAWDEFSVTCNELHPDGCWVPLKAAMRVWAKVLYLQRNEGMVYVVEPERGASCWIYKRCRSFQGVYIAVLFCYGPEIVVSCLWWGLCHLVLLVPSTVPDKSWPLDIIWLIQGIKWKFEYLLKSRKMRSRRVLFFCTG